MKTIIPIKLIIGLNSDNTPKDCILQYKINDGGALSSKANTINVKDGLTADSLTRILTEAKQHAAEGEGI